MKKSVLFILSLIFLFQFDLSAGSNVNFFLLTDRGLYYSGNSGSSWDRINSGLPESFIPERIYSSADAVYLTTHSSGIFRLDKGSKKWKNITSEDFKTRSRFGDSGYRKISAFASDPANSSHLVLATKHTVYQSYNKGETWERLSMKGLASRNYITSVAANGKDVYAGTAFNGIYLFKNGFFSRISAGLYQEPYSGDLIFYEETSALEMDRETGNIFLGNLFGKGLYSKNEKSHRWESIKLPQIPNRLFNIHDIKSFKNSIFVSVDNSVYRLHDKSWTTVSYSHLLKDLPRGAKPLSLIAIDSSNAYPPLYYHLNNSLVKRDVSRSAGKKAIYSSIPSIGRDLDRHIKTIKSSGFNSIVIDMKDDFGNIYFPSTNTTAKEIGAARRPVKVVEILKKLKANGIYTIARIVVFKDPKLFNAYNNKYAIKNLQTGGAWKGTAHEYWVDAHSEFVQNYNTELAVELEALGFDEIQFDYIRFPTDGPVDLCVFPYRLDQDTYRSEVIIDFIKGAMLRLKVPVSVDIYGFNSWYHMGNHIGQDMEELSLVVDAISPMVYPSHFGPRFYSRYSHEIRPYMIVKDGGLRSMDIIRGEVNVRPYLQGFRMMSPTWGPGYINGQIKGAIESGMSGFIFWNAKGEYNMIESAAAKKD